MFEDYLALAGRDFSRTRLLVFTGRSGSGKSTAIRFLLDAHADFRARERIVLDAPPFTLPGARADVVAIDDLTAPTDLRAVIAALARARTVLVASHVSPAWFAPLRLALPAAFFRTDRETSKLARYLAEKGIPATRGALVRYAAAFGATYTDLDIILERCPAPSFDDSLARFLKFNRIRESGPVR